MFELPLPAAAVLPVPQDADQQALSTQGGDDFHVLLPVIGI